MTRRVLHLLSNAHLDPVWQWEWEEGAAAALSTFRAAVEFCQEFDGYVFNHNEVILYEWIEEYDPALFGMIQQLVANGKWSIMGGWYLQPDCNMPGGESFVRQILAGRKYFSEKFNVRPTTAINFDSFGHSKGLVQIMNQAGYDSYIFMRTDVYSSLPAQVFEWHGFNGSRVVAHKIEDGYNTALGKASERITQWLQSNPEKDCDLVLWGVGNHGGGPSRVDLNAIAQLQEAYKDDIEIRHSTPEQYFAHKTKTHSLPTHIKDLNPRFVGCYTTMIRIKQKHRQLENLWLMTEKMSSAAELYGVMKYPKDEIDRALRDLMMAQFHDILPGTSIQPGEEASLRLLDHGIETLSRVRARAFFALSAGQEKAAEKHYPILVYNPHPFAVKTIVQCEFMLEDQNWNLEFSSPIVQCNGVTIPSQVEKEYSNLNLDWRKMVVFDVELKPMSMNRFDCVIEMLPEKPIPSLPEDNGYYIFETDQLLVKVNKQTGLIDEYKVNGLSIMKPEALKPIVIQDIEDSWRMDQDRFNDVIGSFSLLSEEDGSRFSGVKKTIPSVRVIEDGAVRSVVEAVFGYGNSYICMTYSLPKQGTEIEVDVRVYWNEKDLMLKLAIPTHIKEGTYVGQTAYGVNELDHDGLEVVAQRWVGLKDEHHMLTCINNGIYGSDSSNGEIRLTLLRSAGYCAHPIEDRPILVQDRFLPRIDQGERVYKFWINAGSLQNRTERIDREATIHNEQVYALSYFPSGYDQPKCEQLITIGDEIVQLASFKKAEDKQGYILRLFEPTGSPRTTNISIPSLGIIEEVALKGFEIKTLRLDLGLQELRDEELCEGL